MSVAPLSSRTHNASPQTNVAPNNDPALDRSHEHTHEHLHHTAFATRGHEDNVVYSQGTTFDHGTVPDASPQDHNLHRRGHPEEDPIQSKAADTKGSYAVYDAEKAASPTGSSMQPEADPQNHRFANLYRKLKPAVHLFIFLLFTGWWIASLILHRHDKNWIIPFLLWLFISLRLLFLYVPITVVTTPMHFVWNNTGPRLVALIPEPIRVPAGALLVIAVILVGSFASPVTADNNLANRAISLFGLAVFIFVLWITSKHRKRIVWHTVIVGMLMQFIIALFVLRTQAGYDIFNFVSTLARELLGFAKDGVAFIAAPDVDITEVKSFFFNVLPAIIFFISIVSVLFYWGTLQWFIGKAAVFFFWSMRVSGAEAVVAAASPFIGQGESAMLIKPFVAHLTIAELHQVMTSGFATIAGSVLVAYIGLGVNGSALISSCVMSIPASLAISKLRWPETEETLTSGRVVIPDDDEHRAANSLHAFANGAWLGLKIAGMILATLLCIIGFVALINGLLGWWGRYLNINDPPLTLELILGYICYPIAFLLGVPRTGNDLFKVAQLIGIKLIQNEFVAYNALQTNDYYADLNPRSRLIVTYALCGFANIGSLGTQIGVLSTISPSRSGDVSRIALSALIAGAISTLTSASIAGLLVTDQAAFYTPS